MSSSCLIYIFWYTFVHIFFEHIHEIEELRSEYRLKENVVPNAFSIDIKVGIDGTYGHFTHLMIKV